MRIQVLALVGLLTAPACCQRNLRRRGRPAGYSNSTEIPSTSTYSTPAYSSMTYHFNPEPSENVTSSSTPLSTASPSRASNSTAPGDNKPLGCGGQTLNVLTASLDWWYTRTVYNVVSTFSISHNKNDSRMAWTLLPATTSFDLSSALASPTCVGTETWNTVYNQSLWDYECYPAPTPVAASTTVLPQDAFRTPNATSGYGYPPDVVVTPPPASITIPKSGGEYSEGTAFVFFSQYEIITKTVSTYENGSSGCATVTNIYDMEEAFSFEYEDGDANGTDLVGAGVTGDVNPAFLGIVNVTAVKAGSWVAAPTVAIVVQNIVAEEAVLAAARPGFGPLTTETVLQTPEPTLPTFDTPPPPKSTGNNLSPPPTQPGHIEVTNTRLQTPTKNPPPPPTPPPPGQKTTKKPNPPNSPNPPETNGPGPSPPNNQPKPTTTAKGIAHAISIIFSAIRPTTTTNALSVLNSALQTFPQTNPTVGAILHGVDGHKPNDNNRNDAPAPLGPVPDGTNNGVGSGPNGNPVIVVGGTTFTGNSQTQFVLGPGATLAPGGQAVVHGTTVSLASGATAVVINGQTFNAAQAQITPAPAVTVGGIIFAPIGGHTYNVDGQTLTPGGVIIQDGTTISLDQAGTAVVINGQTSILPVAALPATSAGITSAPTLTIGNEPFTAIATRNGIPTYIINGETLTPGESETVSLHGTTYIISLASPATLLKIETEGRNGDVTATSFETLFANGGGKATTTRTVEPTAGAAATSVPSASVKPANAASTSAFGVGGVCLAVGSLLLAVWL